MTADNGGDKTAEQLLAQLITERKHIMVLEYSKAHGLESDSAVFFLVALLETFAFAYDRMLTTVGTAEAGREQIVRATNMAVSRIDSILSDRVLSVEKALTSAMGNAALHITQLQMTAGEVKLLNEQLATTVRDANEAFAAYKSLKGDPHVPSLTRLFQNRLLAALDKRVPTYDTVFREQLLETIHLGMGRYFVIVQIQIVALGVLMGILVRYFA